MSLHQNFNGSARKDKSKSNKLTNALRTQISNLSTQEHNIVPARYTHAQRYFPGEEGVLFDRKLNNSTFVFLGNFTFSEEAEELPNIFMGSSFFPLSQTT